MTRWILAAGAAVVALASLPAQATLNCAVLIDNALTANCLPSNNGALVLTPVANPLFSAIGLTGSGFPALPAPDLSTITLDVTSSTGFSGTHTLTIDIFQNGMPATPAGALLASTFTINHLIGAPFGPSTLATYIDGTASTLGTQVQHADFALGVTNATTGPLTDVLANAITADAQSFSITFTAPNQSANDTIQLLAVQPVSEPSSLLIIGSALVGLAWAIRRRTQDGSFGV